jgi:hypothetical protein
MPKKMTLDPKPKMETTFQKKPIVSSTNNNPNQSIVEKMHFQNGMTVIKQDLQRKIHNYQSILKKTYQDKRQ